jgi:hypothetical protein
VTTFFASGSIIDLILAMMVAEALILVTFRSITGRGAPQVEILTNLLAGAFLMMALRNALIQSHWTWTAAWLAAALLAHVADLAARWRD